MKGGLMERIIKGMTIEFDGQPFKVKKISRNAIFLESDELRERRAYLLHELDSLIISKKAILKKTRKSVH